MQPPPVHRRPVRGLGVCRGEPGSRPREASRKGSGAGRPDAGAGAAAALRFGRGPVQSTPDEVGDARRFFGGSRVAQWQNSPMDRDTAERLPVSAMISYALPGAPTGFLFAL